MKFYLTLSTVPTDPEQSAALLHFHDPDSGCGSCILHDDSTPSCKAAGDSVWLHKSNSWDAPGSCPLRKGPVVVSMPEENE